MKSNQIKNLTMFELKKYPSKKLNWKSVILLVWWKTKHLGSNMTQLGEKDVQFVKPGGKNDKIKVTKLYIKKDLISLMIFFSCRVSYF